MKEPKEGGYDRHEVREPNGPRGGYVVSDRSPGGSLTHSIPHGPSSPLYLRRLRPVTEGNGSEESEKPRNEGPKVDSRTERKQAREDKGPYGGKAGKRMRLEEKHPRP